MTAKNVNAMTSESVFKRPMAEYKEGVLLDDYRKQSLDACLTKAIICMGSLLGADTVNFHVVYAGGMRFVKIGKKYAAYNKRPTGGTVEVCLYLEGLCVRCSRSLSVDLEDKFEYTISEYNGGSATMFNQAGYIISELLERYSQEVIDVNKPIHSLEFGNLAMRCRDDSDCADFRLRHGTKSYVVSGLFKVDPQHFLCDIKLKEGVRGYAVLDENLELVVILDAIDKGARYFLGRVRNQDYFVVLFAKEHVKIALSEHDFVEFIDSVKAAGTGSSYEIRGKQWAETSSGISQVGVPVTAKIEKGELKAVNMTF